MAIPLEDRDLRVLLLAEPLLGPATLQAHAEYLWGDWMDQLSLRCREPELMLVQAREASSAQLIDLLRVIPYRQPVRGPGDEGSWHYLRCDWTNLPVAVETPVRAQYHQSFGGRFSAPTYTLTPP